MDIIERLKEKNNLEFTQNQLNMINHLNGPALTLATAGSGKTTITCTRIANLIETHSIQPSKILTLSYSKTAAEDIQDRFNLLFTKKIHLLKRENTIFSTIHSFALSVVGYYGHRTNTQFHIINDRGSFKSKYYILKNIFQKINKKPPTPLEMEKLMNAISYVKNNNLSGQTSQEKFHIRSFSFIVQSYENYKSLHNLIDFDDMINKCYTLLKQNYSLREYYKQKYDFIQIDEAQDMSELQYEIIKLISNDYSNIILIGDDDQCIYGYRGSRPELLMKFSTDFSNVKKYYLEYNYRSTKTITEISKKFIEKNALRFEKVIKSKNSIEKPIIIDKFKNEDIQNKYIIQEIQQNYNEELNDTAILYRDNLSVISMVYYLTKHQIPFYIRTGELNFFNHWIKNDIIATFLLADDKMQTNNITKRLYKNDKAQTKCLGQIYNKFNLRISEKQVIQIHENQRLNEDIFTTFRRMRGSTIEQRNAMEKFENHLNHLLKLQPKEAINYILMDMGYENYLKDLAKKTGYQNSTFARYVNILYQLTKNETSIRGFWYRIGSLQQHILESTKNKNKNAITLSTFHSSKGLEFKNTFLIELNEGTIPASAIYGINKKINHEELSEERRLMYVAMTRCKDNLYLLSNNNSSKFVSEIEAIIKERSTI